MTVTGAKRETGRYSANAGKSYCPLCSNRETDLFLAARGVPVHQHLLFDTSTAARGCARGDLELLFCRRCGFVFNAAFDSARLQYSAQYDNSQASSPYFRQYTDKLARYLIRTGNLKDKLIVDVGCGKGDFLRRLCRGGLNRGLGFDPSYVGPEVIEGGAVKIFRKFFNAGSLEGSPDLFVSRYVLEHVAHPIELLSEVRQTLGRSRKAAVFSEIAGLDWVIENSAFWDLYYEHCSYYWRSTFAQSFRQAGFEVTRLKSAFGGQYFWLEARPDDVASSVSRGIMSLGRRLRDFASRYERLKSASLARIRTLHSHGGCAVWGAGAKGVTLLNLLDPGCRLVSYAIDLNPAKQGRYVPGTGHSIHAPEHWKEDPVAAILLMNPSYRDEVKSLMKRDGITARIECM